MPTSSNAPTHDRIMPHAGRSLALVLRGFSSQFVAASKERLVRASSLEKLVAQSGLKFERSQQYPGLDPWQVETLVALGAGGESFQSWPSAPLSWLGSNAQESSGYWLHADPVNLSMTIDGLSLRRVLNTSSRELEGIGAKVQSHLASLQMSWHVANGRAYVRCERELDVRTATPLQAQHLGLHSSMPSGADASELKRLLTELQMLLHPDSIAQAEPENQTNAIWLWGGGTLEPFALTLSMQKSWPALWTDNDYARGIYLFAHSEVNPLPTDMASIISSAYSRALIVTDAQDIATCEERWFAPILEALRRKRLQRVSISIDGWSLDIGASIWRRLFLRPKPLVQLLEVAQ